MTGIVEVDVHGMNQTQAQIAIDAALRRANIRSSPFLYSQQNIPSGRSRAVSQTNLPFSQS